VRRKVGRGAFGGEEATPCVSRSVDDEVWWVGAGATVFLKAKVIRNPFAWSLWHIRLFVRANLPGSNAL